MPTGYCECKGALPYSVLRWARAFGPRMRGGVIKMLIQRQEVNGTLTAQDIAECIGMAWAMLEADAESRLEYPAPDLARVEAAQQAAREGRGGTIDDILNELP